MANTVTIDVDQLDAEIRKQIQKSVWTMVVGTLSILGITSIGTFLWLKERVQDAANQAATTAKLEAEDKVRKLLEDDVFVARLKNSEARLVDKIVDEIARIGAAQSNLEAAQKSLESTRRNAESSIQAMTGYQSALDYSVRNSQNALREAQERFQNAANLNRDVQNLDFVSLRALLRVLKEEDYKKSVLHLVDELRQRLDNHELVANDEDLRKMVSAKFKGEKMLRFQKISENDDDQFIQIGQLRVAGQVSFSKAPNVLSPSQAKTEIDLRGAKSLIDIIKKAAPDSP